MTVADDCKGDEGKLDPAVVAALYLEHGEQLRRFLFGLLRDGNLVGDVVQATFTRAVEVGHTSKEETRKAWLFRVAYNEAMAVRRRQSVDKRATERLSWSTPLGDSSADEPALRYETVEQVRQALGEIPADQAQIVRMRIYEEKTFAVIAQELDIPLGTALGRMRAALKKLRDKLQWHSDS